MAPASVGAPTGPEQTAIFAFRSDASDPGVAVVFRGDVDPGYSLGPATEMIWLGYDRSPAALNLDPDPERADSGHRSIKSDLLLADPQYRYRLDPSGGAHWAPIDAVPPWLLDLELPYLELPQCPQFGAAEKIEVLTPPTGITFFEDHWLVASLSATRALAITDLDGEHRSRIVQLGQGSPVSGIYARGGDLFLGDEDGKLWRAELHEPEAITTMLGPTSTRPCAIVAIDGDPDGEELVAATECGEIVKWSSTEGASVSRTYTGTATPPLFGRNSVEIAWVGPGQAVMLLDRRDLEGAPPIWRSGASLLLDPLPLPNRADSLARLTRGLRVGAHEASVFSSLRSVLCPGAGCGRPSTTDPGSGWEIDGDLPLTLDDPTRIAPYREGLVFGNRSGAVGFYFRDDYKCPAFRQDAIDAQVTELVAKPGALSHAVEGAGRNYVIYTPVID